MANMGQMLGAGQQLNKNGYLWTGDYQLVFQDDGNLVLYMSPGPNQVVKWASNTYGQDAQYAIMQTDGNLVIYGSDQPPNALLTLMVPHNVRCGFTILIPAS